MADSMLTFKQFLIEMPFISTGPDHSSYDLDDSFSNVPAGAEKIDQIRGTKDKYDLYKHTRRNIVRFLAVHRETGKVHMQVSGDINPETSHFNVSVLRSAHKGLREPNMGLPFYQTIRKHHTMVSDSQHTLGSYKLYDKLAKTGGKMTEINPEKENSEELPVDPGNISKHYTTNYSDRRSVTAFKVYRST